MIDEAALVELLRVLSDGVPLSLPEYASAHPTQAAHMRSLDAHSQRMLRDHGVDISGGEDPSHTRLQILAGTDRLTAAQIAAHLPGELRARLGAAMLEVTWSLDSTNLRLLELARHKDIDHRVLTAEHQSAGRGRRGRHWLSPVACNIYLSVGCRLPRVDQMQALSLLVGVGVADALTQLGYVGIGIKWPNDLQHQGRKLAGILIESGLPTPRGISLVIGVGINVRVPAYVGEQIDQPWTDLTTIAQQLSLAAPARNQICAAAIAGIFAATDAARQGNGARSQRAALLERFTSYDVLRDKPIIVQVADRQERGTARGIDGNGELRVEDAQGIRAVSAGEVSIRPV